MAAEPSCVFIRMRKMEPGEIRREKLRLLQVVLKSNSKGGIE